LCRRIRCYWSNLRFLSGTSCNLLGLFQTYLSASTVVPERLQVEIRFLRAKGEGERGVR
jgi:hypothetical protein